jgi:hypothetical protein
MMMKKLLQLIIILLLMPALAGCAAQANKVQDAQNAAVILDAGPGESGNLLEERAELEKERQAQLGEFYVPLPPVTEEPQVKTVKARGLYITANVAGFDFAEDNINYYADYISSISGQSGQPADTSRLAEINKLEKALAICESTEVNALVIDIKNDEGLVAWQSDIDLVNQIKSNGTIPFQNYAKLIDYLKKKDIYCIARVVAFKDPYLAELKSEHTIQLKTGGVYQDRAGVKWVNPFDEYIWKYLVAISREAALRGFDEIQFDYVRFPDNAQYYNSVTEFPGRSGRDKDEGIEAFLEYAGQELEPYNIHISADVFGVITRSWDDKPEDIGQTWGKIADQVDYICPMIYPSHYGPGIYGYIVPDQYPYDVVRQALMEALERNAAANKPGVIRPWYQGFTAPWIRGHIDYTATKISDQMTAGLELGIEEYIIWNAVNNYDPLMFFYHNRINTSIRKSGEDILARTPETALRRYLEAEKNQRYSIRYLLTPLASRPDDYDEFVGELEKSPLLKSYEILTIGNNGDGTYMATIREDYGSDTGTAGIKEVQYKIFLEKDVYKVMKM